MARKTYTFETAPKGYTGPVKLRPQDIAARDAAEAAWEAEMVAMAQDETAHPEDRAKRAGVPREPRDRVVVSVDIYVRVSRVGGRERPHLARGAGARRPRVRGAARPHG